MLERHRVSTVTMDRERALCRFDKVSIVMIWLPICCTVLRKVRKDSKVLAYIATSLQGGNSN
jgi:hypothetical protein